MNIIYKNLWIYEFDVFWLLCNFVNKKIVVLVKYMMIYFNCKFDIVYVIGVMLSKFFLRRKILSMKLILLYIVYI